MAMTDSAPGWCALTGRRCSDVITEIEQLRLELACAKPLYSRRQLEAEVDRLRAALAFYANEDNHKQVYIPSKGFTVSETIIDNGEKARAALVAGAKR